MICYELRLHFHAQLMVFWYLIRIRARLTKHWMMGTY